MDTHYYYGNARTLKPGAYKVAVWVEYEGGELSNRAHFLLHVDKDPHAKNRLERDSD